jgi:anti-sigma factor RsiW
MSCPTSQELSLFHDGALDAGRSRQVELHTAACAACAGELADLRRLSVWLARQRPEPSADAVRRVADFADSLAVHDEAPTLGTLRRVGRILTGIAASVLVFGVIRLAQQPAAGTVASRGVNVAGQDWEQVVLGAGNDESAAPEPTQFADWVVSGLSHR